MAWSDCISFTRARSKRISSTSLRERWMAEFGRNFALHGNSSRISFGSIRSGDPFANLHTMGLRMMHRIVPPLHVVYGVDLARKIVYLQSVAAFPPDSY